MNEETRAQQPAEAQEDAQGLGDPRAEAQWILMDAFRKIVHAPKKP